ncbi:MAG: DUF1640 domain-containing protein [Magnetococcales bacterium]|nr:DUF1640 domain-containing protein [Magnetococcales bacterium]
MTMLAMTASDENDFIQRLQGVGVSAEQSATFIQIFEHLIRRNLASPPANTTADIVPIPANLSQALSSLRDAVNSRASKQDLVDMGKNYDLRVLELQRDIKELDVKQETTREELKRDIKELDTKLETTKKELDTKLETTKKELDTKLETTKKELEFKLEATKEELRRDIKELEVKLTSQIELARIETQRDIATVKTSLIQWVAGFLFAQSTLTLGAVYAMIRFMVVK